MKKRLLIDIDSSRKDTVIIGNLEGDRPQPEETQKRRKAIVSDMACLCEAMCTLIHVAHQNKLKPMTSSFEDCVKHISAGLRDKSYQGIDLNELQTYYHPELKIKSTNKMKKNKLIIEYDPDKDETLLVGKTLPGFKMPKTKEDKNALLLEDLECITFAVASLIKAGEKSGADSVANLMKATIKRLEEEVFEGSSKTKAGFVEDYEKESGKKIN